MRVEISEVTDAYRHYKSQVNSIKGALSETTSSLLGLANTDGFSGKLANNVRSYIDEVDLNAIGLILKSYDELDHEFQSALNTFASDIDSDDSAIVDTDTLSDVITALDRYDSDIGTILTEADAAIMTASAFANVVVPKSSALEHAMLETRKTVSDLKLAMEAFDGMTNIKSKLAEINLVSSTLITPILKQAGSVHNNAFTDSDLNQSTTKEGKRLTKLRDEKFGDINKEAQNIHQKRQQQKRIETAMYNLKHNGSMDYYSEPSVKESSLKGSSMGESVKKLNSYLEAVDTDNGTKLASNYGVHAASGLKNYAVRGFLEASIPFAGKVVGGTIDYNILRHEGKSKNTALDEATAHVLVGQLTEMELVAITASMGAEAGGAAGSIEPGAGNALGATGGGAIGAITGDLGASGVAWKIDNEYDSLYESGHTEEANDLLNKVRSADNVGKSTDSHKKPKISTNVQTNANLVENNPEVYGTDNF